MPVRIIAAMKELLTLGLLAGVLAACGVPQSGSVLQQTDSLYLEAARSHDTEFDVPKADNPAAWERARSIITRLANLPLDRSDEVFMRTKWPDSLHPRDYSYQVSRELIGDHFRFRVEAYRKSGVRGDTYIGTRADREHELVIAYYISTGRPIPERIMNAFGN